MNPVAPRLPAVLGSSVALMVVFVSFLAQTSPMVCVMRAAAAFAVFAAFGIVIRYLLGDAVGNSSSLEEAASDPADSEEIAPGTPVAELLDAEERQEPEEALQSTE